MLVSGFHLITFEMMSVLDSYFMHRCRIIKYRSILIRVKSPNYFGTWPFFNFIFLQNACFRVRMAPGQVHLCCIDTFLVLLNLFSFTLFNLEEKNEYLIDLDLSVCLEDGRDCVFGTTIFENTVMTKTPCNLNQGYVTTGKMTTTTL